MTAPLKSHQPYRRLYRAFVSLPTSMQERIVFFEGPMQGEAAHLEQLLALVWAVDTTDWCRDGHIYNLCHARDLLAENLSESHDARLLEIGWGGDSAIHYASAADVDLFVAPQVHGRLSAALHAVSSGNGLPPAYPFAPSVAHPLAIHSGGVEQSTNTEYQNHVE